jgi:hypothetical protein
MSGSVRIVVCRGNAGPESQGVIELVWACWARCGAPDIHTNQSKKLNSKAATGQQDKYKFIL